MSAAPSDRAGSHPATVAAVLVLLAASAVVYRLLLDVQRSVFLNGVPAADPRAVPRPPTDPAALASAPDRYLPLVGIQLLLYVLLLVMVRWSRGRLVGLIAAGAGIVGHLVLVPTTPTLSIDLYSYLAHGHLAATAGHNPYVTAAADVVDTPFGASLMAQGWAPVHPQTPYGPLWTHIEQLAVLGARGELPTAVLILKAVVVAATIGTGLLAWTAARRLRPGAGPLAASAWLLNPLVVLEFGVDGHNDAVAIFFTAAALVAALQGWAVVAVLALAAGTLVKWSPIAFALPVAVMLLRQAKHRGRQVLAIGISALASIAAGWWLWSPWWVGFDTLAGLRASTTPTASLSPAGWLATVLADVPGSEPVLTPTLAAAGALLVVVLAASWGRNPTSWLAGCAVIAVAVLAVSPMYWPWYSALPVAVLALRPTGIALSQIVVLTAGSRFVALWGDVAFVGGMSYQDLLAGSPIAGITVPVAACALLGAVGGVVGLIRRRTHSSPK